MSNTELINAYFDNELSASEKKMFEDRLTRDTDLQQEYKFHEEIIEGIREVRRQSLKARLDKVQVGGSAGSSWTAGKITGLIGLVAVAGLAIYYLYPDNSDVQPIQTEEVITLNDSASDATDILTEDQENQSKEDTSELSGEKIEDNTAVTEDTPEQPAENIETIKPEVKVTEENKNPVVAPSFEDPKKADSNVTLPEGKVTGKAMVSTDNLEVAVNNTNKRYDFHYALENKQLILYGDFQNELYEILEFNTATMKSWFLSYGGSFYSLEQTNGKITSLEKVTDTALLNTLKEASKD